MQLADPGEQVPPRTRLGVVRRALVRVLAVDEVGHLDEARGVGLRERVDVAEPARDRRLVGRRGREGLRSEHAAGLAGDTARLAQLGEDRAVALGLAHGRDVREVLGRRAQHRRAADVDHLDRVLLLDAAPRDDLREGVEVDADEVERADAVLVERGEVVRVVSAGQDRGVDPRVQGLHAAAEELGDLGQVLDPRGLDSVLLEVVGGAAAGDQLDAELFEPTRELGETFLVERGQEGALDHDVISSRTACGKRRCSTAWTRARSVSTVSSSWIGTRSATMTGPVSMPSST